MQDNEIDLTLAKNYVPACLTFVKCVFLLIMLELLERFHMESGVTTVMMLLLIDRLYTKIYIFDGNVILLFITLTRSSHWIKTVSLLTEKDREMFTTSWWVTSFLWAVFSLYTQTIHGCIHQNHLRIYFVITSCFVSIGTWLGLTSSINAQEIYITRVIRGSLFCILSLIWIYIIGIHKHRMTKPNESGIHFIVYFSPCLYVSLSIFICFVVSVIVSMFWVSITQNVIVLPVIAEEVSVCSLNNVCKEKSNDDLELEELSMLLRQAKEAKDRKSTQ